jgi:hypothetical protein
VLAGKIFLGKFWENFPKFSETKSSIIFPKFCPNFFFILFEQNVMYGESFLQRFFKVCIEFIMNIDGENVLLGVSHDKKWYK